MLNWLGTHFRTFLLALALAVVVWISAVSSSDPNVTRLYPSPIPLEVVGQDPGLVQVGDIPTEIGLSLKAPQSIWNVLDANPDAIRAVLDLSGLSAGTHTVRVQVQIDERPVQIMSVAPDSLTFVLEPLITRTLPVALIVNGDPAVGYSLGDPVIEPSKVVISGAQSLVQRASEARTAVNASNTRENIGSTVPVVVLDKENRPLGGLTVNPDSVHVSVPVLQQGGYRDLAVKVVVTGQVASGYHLTSISVYPPVVTVFASDPALVNALPGYVETSSLDLEGAKADIEKRLALILPPGVSVVGDQTVLVQASVSAIESSVTLLDQPVEVVGLAPGLAAQISPPTVDIILSGPLPVLEGLTPSDVHVVIDLTGFSVGTHQVVPRIDLPGGGITVESIIPATLEVILIQITPTPRP
jgi:YbbR domain-containing protein